MPSEGKEIQEEWRALLILEDKSRDKKTQVALYV